MAVAELLLEMGADVETPDNYGQSPFFMACWKGHSDVAGLLLEFDANKDCRTKTGITPLFQVGWRRRERGRERGRERERKGEEGRNRMHCNCVYVYISKYTMRIDFAIHSKGRSMH